MKVLFLLKKREIQSENPDEWNYAGCSRSSGLYNSVMYITKMLNSLNADVDAEMIEVIDGNSIDAIVYKKVPDAVFIEALWVTPEKLAEVQKLHKHITWYVRLHSEISFLATESIAIEWLKKYVEIPNVNISCNSERCGEALSLILNRDVYYHPNYYGEGDEDN